MSDLTALPAQPDGVPWPTEVWPTAEPRVADPDRLRALVERPFSDPAPEELGHTHALLVVHRGELVAERYGTRFVGELEALAGVTPDQLDADTPHISWSMAKSVLHTVVGLLAADGKLSIDDAPPVPQWQEPGDPRGAITWDHLLQMRSGLAWTEEYYEFAGDALPDVVTMLYGDARRDMAAFAASFPLVHEPGSVEAYNYSSGTSNIVSAAAGSLVGGGEAGMRGFLRERLFDPIGMASATPTFDAAGTFTASSYLDATARDFARFGLLALRDGVWDGQRLLPEGWVDHGRLPRSQAADDSFVHGAHWWSLPSGRWGTFLADGFEGQRIYLVPALDLVLVRLGKTHTSHSATMDAHLLEIIGCFG